MESIDFNQQLSQSFENMNGFFHEIASLLRDCDRLIGEEGYTTFNGNTAIYEQSRSLLNPEAWIPSYFCRAYALESEIDEKSPNEILFISLFLRYDGGCKDIIMNDNVPLIVCGIIIPHDPKSFKFEGWLSKKWFWIDSPEKNNILNDEVSKPRSFEIPTGQYNNSKSITTFAYPLEKVKSTIELKDHIIQKLVESARKLKDN
jgi:hypothetical protein